MHKVHSKYVNYLDTSHTLCRISGMVLRREPGGGKSPAQQGYEGTARSRLIFCACSTVTWPRTSRENKSAFLWFFSLNCTVWFSASLSVVRVTTVWLTLQSLSFNFLNFVRDHERRHTGVLRHRRARRRQQQQLRRRPPNDVYVVSPPCAVSSMSSKSATALRTSS